MGNCCWNAARRDSDISLISEDDYGDNLANSNREQADTRDGWISSADINNQMLTNSLLHFLTPGVVPQSEYLSEDDQVQAAKRIGIISHLPVHLYATGTSSKNIECIICMVEYAEGDRLRCLPCTHSYHKDCIDNWLMRSFACPTCNRAVDSALVTAFSPPDA